MYFKYSRAGIVYVVTLNGGLHPNASGRQANTSTTNCIPDETPVIEQVESTDDLATVHVANPQALRASTLKNATVGLPE